MITVRTEENRKISRFWNHALFHPTDAVEDPWGKRILDRMAKDGAVKCVRIYAMLEDIVYLDENNRLQYDFRLNDLRLDYLLEKGFTPLIAYAGMPDCIADNTHAAESNAKNKTRYKGKLFNTNLPRDFALWEEVCYQYTLHNIERYGIDRVSTWHCQCWNEPDARSFFLSKVPENDVDARIEGYIKLYDYFQRGVRRASERIPLGGPTLSGNHRFLDSFLGSVRRGNMKLDYLSLHNYGTSPVRLNEGKDTLTVENNVQKQKDRLDIIEKHGFSDTPIIIDEWGASSHGFYNIEECPVFMFRENEVFSAYYTRLIYRFLEERFKVELMMICLSGQHEMLEDFSGFRNFFTLNFIAKPIYNAYVMASKLGESLLSYESANKSLSVIPTKKENGDYAIMLTYAGENFEEDLPDIEETILLPEDALGKKLSLYLIDRTHTNPYRLAERNGIGCQPTQEEIALLRREGTLTPVAECTLLDRTLRLHLEANATVLITLEEQ